MNDNDVIKGLEELTDLDNPGKLSLVVRLFLEDVLSCINRLQAENERLQKICEMNAIAICYENGITAEIIGKIKNEVLIKVEHDVTKIKSEARKEFAERLHKELDFCAYDADEMRGVIDNLLEEMEKEV